MNQRRKLETIAPRLSPVANSQAPVVPKGLSAPSPVKIDTKRTSVGLFSLSYLLSWLPGWAASFVGHLLMIALLAVVLTSTQDKEAALEIDAVILEASEVDEEEIRIQRPDSEAETELLNFDVAALSSEASEESIEPIHDDGMSVSLLDGLGDGIGMEAMAASGLTPIDSNARGGLQSEASGSTTEFFGTEASGDRFVFVIDCSGSMSELFLWERAVTELGKSLEKLSEEHHVMVLLYNSQTIPMFNGDPEKLEMLPVTFKFRKALGEWLGQQKPFGKTKPAHALSYSLTLNPDAIFLLSDGQIADNSLQVLAALNLPRQSEEGGTEGKVPVHTISLGPNELGVVVMQMIAADNEGEFTRVR